MKRLFHRYAALRSDTYKTTAYSLMIVVTLVTLFALFLLSIINIGDSTEKTPDHIREKHNLAALRIIFVIFSILSAVPLTLMRHELLSTYRPFFSSEKSSRTYDDILSALETLYKINMNKAERFLCPITLAVMQNPAYLVDKNSHERVSCDFEKSTLPRWLNNANNENKMIPHSHLQCDTEIHEVADNADLKAEITIFLDKLISNIENRNQKRLD